MKQQFYPVQKTTNSFTLIKKPKPIYKRRPGRKIRNKQQVDRRYFKHKTE